jgi:predicted transcriptional regulator
MEVLFTAEREARLARSAAQQGRQPDELVQQAVAQYFDKESRFVDAVNRGESALQQGEYLTHELVPHPSAFRPITALPLSPQGVWHLPLNAD